MEKISAFFLSILAALNIIVTPTPVPTSIPNLFITSIPSPSTVPTWKIINPPITNNNNNNITNLVDCVGPDQKIFKTTMTACEKLNRDWGKESDYLVNCQIHQNCGSGSILIKKSLCDKSYCCFFKSGPVLLYDKSQCVESNTQRSYQYPTYSPLPTWTPLPTFVPLPTTAPFPTYYYVPPIVDSDECKAKIRSTYTDLIKGCNIRFGASSATEACEKIYSDERDRKLTNCGN